MFELVWGIINIVLLIGFIIFLIKIIKLVRKEIGLAAAFIVTFAFIMSFFPSNDKNSNLEFPLSEVHETLHKNTKNQRVELANNAINKTFVHLRFSENNDLSNANLKRSGLVAFTGLTPNILVSDKIGENHFKYFMIYSKNWYLLGIKVYTQNLEFHNEISF